MGGTYNFDYENHLTKFNSGLVRYVNDGDGNRVAKITALSITKYLIDTNNLTGYAQVIDEITQGGSQTPQVTRTYTYGSDLISETQLTGGHWNTSFYGYDGHGSVRLLTDATEAVTNIYTYDAFGTLIKRTGNTPNDYLYSGEQYDANLGFYYLRARYMNPSSGRFWSMDSYEGESNDPLSLHKFLYVTANPVMLHDPSGLMPSPYSQAFAAKVEDEIELKYTESHPEDEPSITYGKWARVGDNFKLNPDILNHRTKTYLEIMPLSLTGVATATLQMAIYSESLSSVGYKPDVEWSPSPNTIYPDNVPTLVFNVQGVLFYTDSTQLAEEAKNVTEIVALYGTIRAAAGVAPPTAVARNIQRTHSGKERGLKWRSITDFPTLLESMIELESSLSKEQVFHAVFEMIQKDFPSSLVRDDISGAADLTRVQLPVNLLDAIAPWPRAIKYLKERFDKLHPILIGPPDRCARIAAGLAQSVMTKVLSSEFGSIGILHIPEEFTNSSETSTNVEALLIPRDDSMRVEYAPKEELGEFTVGTEMIFTYKRHLELTRLGFLSPPDRSHDYFHLIRPRYCEMLGWSPDEMVVRVSEKEMIRRIDAMLDIVFEELAHIHPLEQRIWRAHKDVNLKHGWPQNMMAFIEERCFGTHQVM